MVRFFATLPFRKIAWRSNRSISTDGEALQARDHINIRKEGNDGVRRWRCLEKLK